MHHVDANENNSRQRPGDSPLDSASVSLLDLLHHSIPPIAILMVVLPVLYKVTIGRNPSESYLYPHEGRLS